jgi:hypothetical protein
LKLRYILIPCTVVTLILAAIGISQKASYTDITGNGSYLSTIEVGEIPEELAEQECSNMRSVLPQQPIILRVTPVETVEQIFCASRQKVRVEQVFSGDDIEVNDEIYLTSSNWALSLDETHPSMQRGFVNILDTEKTYLVFIKGKILDDSVPVYALYDDGYITPAFCYDTIENVIAIPSDDTTFVPYREVQNNEFFALSEKALNAMVSLKEQMITLFPSNV